MKESLISIIVPVFNAERFLPQCIESILCQSYVNWEMIAVDDGSTDKSLEILNAYSAKDPRIHIISKGNEGVSIARNVALSQAKGDYVYFVDADDEVMPNGLKILLEEMENTQATFVKSDFLPIDEQGKQVFINKKQVIRQRYDGKMMESGKFFKKILMKEYFLWTCLFRKEIIEKHHILFIPHCRLMEDAAFVVDYLLYSDRNVYKNACVYGYRKYDGTVSAVNKDYTEDMMLIKKHIKQYSKSYNHISLFKNINNYLNESDASFITRLKIRLAQFIDRVNIICLYNVCKYI